MTSFDPDGLLALLPRRVIIPLPSDTPVPRPRAVSDMSAYNGFTGKERLRPFEIWKWLVRLNAVQQGDCCNICGRYSRGQHAEDYYTLVTWMDICDSCHQRLHKRFSDDRLWLARLDEAHVPATHWSRAVSREPFDLAGLLRGRGGKEAAYSDHVTTAMQGKTIAGDNRT